MSREVVKTQVPATVPLGVRARMSVEEVMQLNEKMPATLSLRTLSQEVMNLNEKTTKTHQ